MPYYGYIVNNVVAGLWQLNLSSLTATQQKDIMALEVKQCLTMPTSLLLVPSFLQVGGHFECRFTCRKAAAVLAEGPSPRRRGVKEVQRVLVLWYQRDGGSLTREATLASTLLLI